MKNGLVWQPRLNSTVPDGSALASATTPGLAARACA